MSGLTSLVQLIVALIVVAGIALLGGIIGFMTSLTFGFDVTAGFWAGAASLPIGNFFFSFAAWLREREDS